MEQQNNTQSETTKLTMPMAVIIAGLMISGAIMYTQSEPSSSSIPKTKVANEVMNIDIKDAPFLGKADAPVTIVEFGDFQCPFCARYFQNTQSLMVSEYVDSGKAKFVWKDYAFLGPESFWAAEAARCANDQNKFWEYHEHLYTRPPAENSGNFSKANLKKYAAELGLNQTEFNKCLDSGKYTAFIQEESQEAVALGVTGTPATFINGRLVVDENGDSVGAASFSTFKQIIDQILKNK